MTMDSPEFKAVREASDELGQMICKFLADRQMNIPHGLAIMAAATIGVIETLCKVIEDDPKEMLDTYISGLQVGTEEELKAKSDELCQS